MLLVEVVVTVLDASVYSLSLTFSSLAWSYRYIGMYLMYTMQGILFANHEHSDKRKVLTIQLFSHT